MILVFFKILREGVSQALRELWVNKLRTLLSVLGITIGIFCVISVFTLVDSVERNVRQSFNKLGDNVLYITNIPWNEDPTANWWRYLKRPYPDYAEYKMLQKNLVNAEAIAVRALLQNKELKYKNNTIGNVRVIAGTHEYNQIIKLEIEEGRYFTHSESNLGRNVIVIGYDLAQALFPGGNAVNRQVKLMGRKLTVTGVLKKEGESILDAGFDETALIPYHYLRGFMDVDARKMIPAIGVTAPPDVPLQQLKDEITGLLRSDRKLKPNEESNFAINEMSLLSSVLDNVFGVVSLAGLVIGIFSILVGGFGIANIMFVSVSERTGLIGIKKSLGAKSYFILFEFLIEAVCLSLLGGLLGLVLVYFATEIGSYFISMFEPTLDFNNVMRGIMLSLVVGLVAGIVPAFNASRMNPVEAIRQNF